MTSLLPWSGGSSDLSQLMEHTALHLVSGHTTQAMFVAVRDLLCLVRRIE